MQLLKISPKGQITIPKSARNLIVGDQLLFETKGKTIMLRSVVILFEKDDTDGFSNLSTPSFDFWNDQADDVYTNFYNKKK